MLHDFIDGDVIIQTGLGETLKELLNTELRLGLLFGGSNFRSEDGWCFAAYHAAIMDK